MVSHLAILLTLALLRHFLRVYVVLSALLLDPETHVQV